MSCKHNTYIIILKKFYVCHFFTPWKMNGFWRNMSHRWLISFTYSGKWIQYSETGEKLLKYIINAIPMIKQQKKASNWYVLFCFFSSKSPKWKDIFFPNFAIVLYAKKNNVQWKLSYTFVRFFIPWYITPRVGATNLQSIYLLGQTSSVGILITASY